MERVLTLHDPLLFDFSLRNVSTVSLYQKANFIFALHGFQHGDLLELHDDNLLLLITSSFEVHLLRIKQDAPHVEPRNDVTPFLARVKIFSSHDVVERNFLVGPSESLNIGAPIPVSHGQKLIVAALILPMW
jgi:hypothetical protein